MTRTPVLTVGLVLLLAPLAICKLHMPMGSSHGTESVVVKTTVSEHSAEHEIFGFPVGRKAGIEVGDPVLLLGDAQSIVGGSVFMVTDDACAVRIEESVRSISVGRSAAIVRRSTLRTLCDRLPPGVTLRGNVSAVAPGRGTAWLDLGRNSGLRLGNEVLIWRRDVPTATGSIDIPIARGSVVLLDGDVALVSLQPIVSNALTGLGDSAELWPVPAHRRWHQLDSAVLQVELGSQKSPEPLVTIVGGTVDGLTEGRSVELFRGDQYVGVAVIVETGPILSQARVVQAMSAETPAEGDRVLVRSPTSPASGPPSSTPLSAALFRLEEDYGLLAAGENEGVRTGEKFIVYRRDPKDPATCRAVAELTVVTVKIDYAGTTIRPLTDDTPAIQPWDRAERQDPHIVSWRVIGIVDQVHPDLRAALVSLDPRCRLPAGRVIRWVAETGNQTGAGIIVERTSDTTLIYVPPAWGHVNELLRARIEADIPLLTSAPATTTAPAR